MAENKETNQEVQDIETQDNAPETKESVNDVQELSSKVKQSVVLPESLQEQVKKTERRTVKKLVEETIAGKFGSGRERMILLGDKYEAVQKEINLRIRKGEL